jgi:hypothetical protein
MKQMVIPRKTSRARNRCLGAVIFAILGESNQEMNPSSETSGIFHRIIAMINYEKKRV